MDFGVKHSDKNALIITNNRGVCQKKKKKNPVNGKDI